MKKTVTKSLMFIASSDYDSLIEKGVVDMISERSEGDYFNNVYSVHPLAKKTRKILIKNNHNLYEFGVDSIWYGASFKILRYFYSPIYFLIAVKKTRNLIIKNNIDIVRASDPYWAAIIGYFSTLFINTKFVISIHADWDKRHDLDPCQGAPKLFFSRKLIKLIENFLLKKADKVICIRKSLFKYVIDQGVDKERLIYMPHGINLKNFYKERGRLDTSKFKIISFVGRVSKENYIYDLFEVIKFFSNRKDCKFVIAGDGPELSNLKRLANEYNLDKNKIDFRGFISKKKVANLRKKSFINVVLMGGLSLIEAAASGNPVVTYDIEWHSEIIKNNLTGKIVKEGDTKNLIKAIIDLLENKKLAIELGKNAQKEVVKNHDINNVQKVRAKKYDIILGNIDINEIST